MCAEQLPRVHTEDGPLSGMRPGSPACFVEGGSMPVLRAESVRSAFLRKHSSCDCSQAPGWTPADVCPPAFVLMVQLEKQSLRGTQEQHTRGWAGGGGPLKESGCKLSR